MGPDLSTAQRSERQDPAHTRGEGDSEMSYNDYIRIPAPGDPMQPRVARVSWIVILTLAAIGGSLALSCVAPFSALAVVLGGTAGVRASLRAAAFVWVSHQVV